MYGGGVGDVVEYAGLTDEVTDHDEAATSTIERTEEGFTHPVGELIDAVLVLHDLVVIKVVDDDIVGAVGAVAQTTR